MYRLITSGTIEEKVYHRQIFKQFLTNKACPPILQPFCAKPQQPSSKGHARLSDSTGPSGLHIA